MLLKACLNGSRHPSEHPALPATPAHIAAEAASAVAAGAGAVHVHPKAADGADTMAPEVVAAVLTEIRSAAPGVPVGVTTGAWIGPPEQRIRHVRQWDVLPDFASVNWHEPGAVPLAELLLDRGVGVEAGLHRTGAVAAWQAWPHRDRTLRVLIEVVADLPAERGLAVAAELLSALDDDTAGVPVLLHGEQTSCWPVLLDAIDRGLDTRIGLEDTVTLPDGRIASGNAELVRVARHLAAGRSSGNR
jgi:uncharacterized protein (DUF849 family)